MMERKLAGYIVNALRGRGHTDQTIAAMEPVEVVAEYCAWYLGDREWAFDILDVAREAGVSLK
jgi:hypothetical protein